MIQIFHNPRCSKSRLGLQHLQNKGLDVSIIQYLDEPPTIDELRIIITKLGIKPLDLIRKNEDIFKQEFKGKSLSDDEWIAAMAKYPKLIERPIVINGNKAVIARPTEAIDEII